MTWNELKKKVVEAYNRRQLKSDVRYRALDKIGDFLKKKYPDVIENATSLLNINRDDIKEDYRKSKPTGKISGAESSAFNEIYNQLNIALQQK